MLLLEADTIDEVWNGLVGHLMTNGDVVSSRAGDCLEERDVLLQISSPSNCWLANRERAADKTYAAAELLWYLSGESSIEHLLPHAPSYAQFANDGHAMGAYGKRWVWKGTSSQLLMVTELLKLHPQTRRAVVTCWIGPQDLRESVYAAREPNSELTWRDIPCTLSLQFLIRNEKLNLSVVMRSNDVWLGMPYDIWCFSMIQRMIADTLGLEYGTYTHYVGSSHLYMKDAKKIRSKEIPARTQPEKYRVDPTWFMKVPTVVRVWHDSHRPGVTAAELISAMHQLAGVSDGTKTASPIEAACILACSKTVPEILV